jgi:hypothetical protein
MITQLIMKKAVILSVFVFAMTLSLFGQQFEKPSEGKTLVYFVRYQGAVAVIDFKYFDGDKYLGRISGNNYFMYECDPGEHVFWLTAENREFIKGNLNPNCTYVIEVRPYMRAIMSGVELNQVSPTDKKALKNIKTLFSKKKPAELKGQDADQSTFIKAGMEQLEANKGKIKELNPDWTF